MSRNRSNISVATKRCLAAAATFVAVAVLLPGAAAATPTIGVSAVTLSKQTVDGRDYIVSDITIAPGGSTGWHVHQGTIYGVVKAGILTHYAADCNQDGVYKIGDPITDPTGADHVHLPATSARYRWCSKSPTSTLPAHRPLTACPTPVAPFPDRRRRRRGVVFIVGRPKHGASVVGRLRGTNSHRDDIVTKGCRPSITGDVVNYPARQVNPLGRLLNFKPTPLSREDTSSYADFWLSMNCRATGKRGSPIRSNLGQGAGLKRDLLAGLMVWSGRARRRRELRVNVRGCVGSVGRWSLAHRPALRARAASSRRSQGRQR